MSNLVTDPRNARKHPLRNKELIRQSLEEVGAFRSIAIDGDGIVRAGNGVYEQAQELGLRIRIVEAAPDELIAVQRPDLKGELAERAAILDNRSSETSEWDTDVLTWLKENQPSAVESMWTDEEWQHLLQPVESKTQDDPEGEDDASDERDPDRFPLAIVLDHFQYRDWLKLKEQLGYREDKDAFLKLLELAGQEASNGS